MKNFALAILALVSSGVHSLEAESGTASQIETDTEAE